MSDLYINIITSIIATGCSILVALIVMSKSNNYNRKLQLRDEKINICNDIEVLVAELSPLLHNLFLKSKYFRREGIALNLITMEQTGISDCKDKIDIIIYKIQMKTKSIREFDWLTNRMIDLKESACSGVDDSENDYTKKTKQLREKLSSQINEYIETL
ncbi:hypothetical protein [Anaerovorax sp. IOR16]|uniref:hypothetical protein n=1 Tax=Anaerovorax sp. IOR16 TaxID=2773458 RepID=UPI0019D08BEA|nr:hypothetical protein [Anaerovorax sp. IOR16]